ncbi:hypothetical protein HYH02_011500 [Chlamydomonas schloesseri]|uniref:Uncharacterized protein n=1 Tax=Chlamydomonas schloesseri TaxID=2026947 RepID=A0A835T5N3_9CHLO|nr:hypothetical protein HYH02_011500 [Chlamydomonas schloesseri]|eukprot:KAG2436563.1 hypothetical protein HYH02_011500 [Chlamydomonas schloesseri]
MTSLLQAITPGRGGGGLTGHHAGAGTGSGVGGLGSATEPASLRTAKMAAEAEDFARRMSEFERGLATFQRATVDFLEGLLPMMSAPLPRVWDQLPDGGLAEPVRARLSHGYPSELLGAGDCDANGLRAAALELERRLVVGVGRPLAQWREALATARQRLPEVERLRRDLDREQGGLDRTYTKAERRHRRQEGLPEAGGGGGGVSGLLYRCTHPRATSPAPLPRAGAAAGPRQVAASDAAIGGGGGAGGGAGATAAGEEAAALATAGGGAPRPFREEFRVEDRNMKTVYRARRKEAVLHSFLEQEGLLNEQLGGLCRDASWLKSYMVAALVAAKETMQSGTYYLGSTKQPVPGHPSPSPATGGLLGAVTSAVTGTGSARVPGGPVGNNAALIRQMPKYLLDRPTRAVALERLRGRLGREGLHAHRAVASPLELHARGDVSGREHVPPVRRGAADRPLGAHTEALTPTGTGGGTGGGLGPAAAVGGAAGGTAGAAEMAEMAASPAGPTTAAASGGGGGGGGMSVVEHEVVPGAAGVGGGGGVKGITGSATAGPATPAKLAMVGDTILPAGVGVV